MRGPASNARGVQSSVCVRGRTRKDRKMIKSFATFGGCGKRENRELRIGDAAPLPAVPDWPESMQGCVKYRQSLDDQAPGA